MANKIKTAWFCTSCGNESPKWMGRCPACGEWNTMVEETVATGKRSSSATSAGRPSSKPIPLSEVQTISEDRISLNNNELNRVLGGGLVEGALVLVAGEPGIGKSTLSLQIPLHCPDLRTLYVTGEESAKQVKIRAERLLAQVPGADLSNCYIYPETLLENIISEAHQVRPDLIVVDSVQTMYSQNIESSPGSVTQIKETAVQLLKLAKDTGIPVILIGHITKEGSIAGPKILEHIVDVVLQFEGDDRGAYRLLRGVKNRFGSTSEVAVFKMTGAGLVEVPNPSELWMPMHSDNLSGITVGAHLDGSRPFLIEVQALVSSAVYGTPQRSATGYDTRRLNMLLAVLEKRAGFKLSIKDVFLNMAGGLKISETACDLAFGVLVLSGETTLETALEVKRKAETSPNPEFFPPDLIVENVAELGRLILQARS